MIVLFLSEQIFFCVRIDMCRNFMTINNVYKQNLSLLEPTVPIETKRRPLLWSHITFLSLNWKDIDLKGGLYSVDKELVRWLQPACCGQWLYIQVDAGHEWFPWRFHPGTGAFQHFYQ